MKTLRIYTKEELKSKEQGYIDMELDYGPALYRGQIKIRGNSTAFGFKKPYAIKLNTTAHLLDGEDDRYILLANCYDPTMMRNYLALKMADKLGIDYTPQVKFVEVYVNDKHQGLYLLTDSVMDKVCGDFLIEAEQWNNPDPKVVHVVTDLGRQYKVHFNNDTDIKTTLDTIDANYTNWAELNDLVDIKSLAKYYVLQEFFKNADVGAASTLYYHHDNKLKACCPWDFDLSSGNYSQQPGLYDSLYRNGDSTIGLYAMKMYDTKLVDNVEFRKIVSKTYAEITPWIEKLSEKMDDIYEKYKEAFDNDIIDQGKSYSQYQIKPLGTLKQNVDFLKNWFIKRHQYLSNEIHFE